VTLVHTRISLAKANWWYRVLFPGTSGFILSLYRRIESLGVPRLLLSRRTGLSTAMKLIWKSRSIDWLINSNWLNWISQSLKILSVSQNSRFVSFVSFRIFSKKIMWRHIGSWRGQLQTPRSRPQSCYIGSGRDQLQTPNRLFDNLYVEYRYYGVLRRASRRFLSRNKITMFQNSFFVFSYCFVEQYSFRFSSNYSS
jgi:hypothetical protein